MTGLQITYLVILSVCVLASGFFSGAETALVGIQRERVEQLLESDRRGRHVDALIRNPDAMLSTLLVANNFVNILAASVATVLFIDLMGEDWGPWAATGAVTSIILVIGEITPKSLATRFPERYSLFVAPTVSRMTGLLRPIARFFLAISRGLMRLFGVRVGDGTNGVTEDDIRALSVLAERSGDIETAEREIIHSLFSLADLSVRDVMTTRIEIHSLASPTTFAEVKEAVAATGHSRFPVIKDDLDNVLGVLYIKDLLGMPHEPTPSDIHRVIRKPVFVPETKSVLDLLLEMRASRFTFTLVSDEHGGVEGLVTTKDLLKELVGELQDEYDPEEPAVLQLGTGEWMVDGRVTVEDLSEAVGTTFPSGEYTTIAGLVLDLAGRIPDPGETIELDGYTVEIIRMDRNRVDRIRLTPRR
ncbi:MAG: hemolysin family protein [Acidimicrobiia bacterium]